MPFIGGLTAEDVGIDLADFLDEDDLPGDFQDWLVVTANGEPSLFDRVNIDEAYDRIAEENKDAVRLLFDNEGSVLLLVDPCDEKASLAAWRLAPDLEAGVPLNPDRVLEAVTEEADQVWSQHDMAERVDLLLTTELSLDHAFQEDAPRELYHKLTDFGGFQMRFR